MKHEIDPQGNIILVPTSRDIELISRSLATKHVQYKATQTSKEAFAEILSLMAEINEAKADSKRAYLKSRPKRIVVPIDTSHQKGLYSRLKHFFHPAFSTHDFEEAITFCEIKHFINSMNFDGSSYPSKVCGEIFYQGRWFAVQWNQYGKCICPNLGHDAKLYNLIRKKRENSKPSKYALLAASLVVITLIIYLSIQ